MRLISHLLAELILLGLAVCLFLLFSAAANASTMPGAIGPAPAGAISFPVADVNGYKSTKDFGILDPGDECVNRTCFVIPPCEQTITTATTPTTDWTAVDQVNNDVICIENGQHAARGKLTLSANATDGTRKWALYTRTGDDDDEPWNQADADRAKVDRIDISGDFWIIHRLTFDQKVEFLEGADSGIVSRTHHDGQRISVNSDDVTIQNSVVHDTPKTPNVDIHCVGSFNGSARNWLVNNEIYNCAGDAWQSNTGADCVDCVIENNDMYVDSTMYCDAPPAATLNPNGDYAASENAVDIKDGGLASATPVVVKQNRMWGFKRTNDLCGSTGSNGDAIVLNGNGTLTDGGDARNFWAQIENNVITEVPVGIQMSASEFHNASIIGNLFFNMRAAFGTPTCFATGDAQLTEFYLNTCIDPGAPRWWNKSGAGTHSNPPNHGTITGDTNDFRCNVIIDANENQSPPANNTQHNHNAYFASTGTKLDTTFVDEALITRSTIDSTLVTVGTLVRLSADPVADCGGTNDTDCFIYAVVQEGTTAAAPPTYCGLLNCVVQDGTAWLKSIRGPLTWRRKLRTVAAGELYYIAYARLNPTTDAPDFQLCPSAAEAGACGSRPGIGVNEQACEVLSPTDIRSVAR